MIATVSNPNADGGAHGGGYGSLCLVLYDDRARGQFWNWGVIWLVHAMTLVTWGGGLNGWDPYFI